MVLEPSKFCLNFPLSEIQTRKYSITWGTDWSGVSSVDPSDGTDIEKNPESCRPRIRSGSAWPRLVSHSSEKARQNFAQKRKKINERDPLFGGTPSSFSSMTSVSLKSSPPTFFITKLFRLKSIFSLKSFFAAIQIYLIFQFLASKVVFWMRGPHTTKVAFALHIQQPQVQFSAVPKFFLWSFLHSWDREYSGCRFEIYRWQALLVQWTVLKSLIAVWTHPVLASSKLLLLQRVMFWSYMDWQFRLWHTSRHNLGISNQIRKLYTLNQKTFKGYKSEALRGESLEVPP